MRALRQGQQLTLQVPATSANMGPGFDTLGMAVGLYNRFTCQLAPTNAVEYDPCSLCDTTSLSTDPARNLFFKAFNYALTQWHCSYHPSIRVCIQANIPLARGLGSSSSVIVAGLLAAWHGVAPPHITCAADLLPLAIALEGHPDNVAPALLGGVQLCTAQGQTYRLPWPADWRVVFVVPPTPLSTHQARAVLPQHVSYAVAVGNLQYTGVLVHALHTANPVAFALALQDGLHQPYRGPLIPQFNQVTLTANTAGAMGTVISGAGSTMAVFVTQQNEPQARHALAQWITHEAAQGYSVLTPPVLV
jgi:homoserine kinase